LNAAIATLLFGGKDEIKPPFLGAGSGRAINIALASS
jgi:hypothetical protein